MRDGLNTDTDGNRRWYANGRRHRIDGPAVEYANGLCEWWMDGKLHRIDGPAIEHANGHRAWWVNGRRHRIDGPAIERANGTRKWYWHGRYYSFREWLEVNTELTAQQKTVLMLKYGDG